MAIEKNQPAVDASEVKPDFQQSEPDQVSDADLQNIAGGALCPGSCGPYTDPAR